MLPGQGYSQVIRNKMPPGTIISSKEESTAVTQDPLNVILLAIIVAALLSVGICSICGFIGYKVAKKRLQIKCQMCRLWIWTKHWNNGEHRGECAKRNEQFLKQLPEPFDIRCPTCLTYLKLMPKVSFKTLIIILQNKIRFIENCYIRQFQFCTQGKLLITFLGSWPPMQR
jgi:hypothetical protein